MTTTIKPGSKVKFWPDRKPFLANESYDAVVVATEEHVGVNEIQPDGSPKEVRRELVHHPEGSARLRISNPHTGRVFLGWAQKSERPAPGAFTVVAEAPAPPAPSTTAAQPTSPARPVAATRASERTDK